MRTTLGELMADNLQGTYSTMHLSSDTSATIRSVVSAIRVQAFFDHEDTSGQGLFMGNSSKLTGRLPDTLLLGLFMGKSSKLTGRLLDTLLLWDQMGIVAGFRQPLVLWDANIGIGGIKPFWRWLARASVSQTNAKLNLKAGTGS